jgi:hypothetical protein
MAKIASSLFMSLSLVLCLQVASAQAQYVRTCVSMAKGSDANTCHCSQPCRTFARAHNQTLSDGEITVLDPGDYGGLAITKSISINNDSTGEASISVSGGTTGIIVNAPNGAGYVNLRGITIQGVDTMGGTGLSFNTGFTLTMTNCVVRNLVGNGIELLPNATSNLAISNTLVADNGVDGILLQPSGSGTVKAVFDRLEVHSNFNGIRVSGGFSTGTVTATVTDSVVHNQNMSSGLLADSTAGRAPTNVMMIRSVSANNSSGIVAFANSTVRVSQSSLTANGVALLTSGGGSILSYADNNIDGNGSGETPSGSLARK